MAGNTKEKGKCKVKWDRCVFKSDRQIVDVSVGQHKLKNSKIQYLQDKYESVGIIYLKV